MIYLDNGATSFPKPAGMLLAMEKCMLEYCGNPGRSGHNMSRRTGEEVYKARNTLAKLFHIKQPERLVFTRNATEALNMGIRGVLQEGDHVVTTSMEHNSVLRPLEALSGNKTYDEDFQTPARGITYTVVEADPDGTIRASQIKKAIRPDTKMVICTHASNVTGSIMPIEEIGQVVEEENNRRIRSAAMRPANAGVGLADPSGSEHTPDQKKVLFLVDGAQTAGAIPIDVEAMKIDMLAVPGHKSLLGPLGTGALYVGPSVQDIEPFLYGGTGTASKELIQPREFPEGYESGTVNAPGIIGLGYSAGMISEVGVEEIQRQEQKLLYSMQDALSDVRKVRTYGPDVSKKTGIITFNIEDISSETVAGILNEQYGIAVRAGYHCAGLAHKTIGTWDTGAVRASLGPYNTSTDVEKAVAAVREIAQKISE